VTPGEYLQALGGAHNASATHPVELIEILREEWERAGSDLVEVTINLKPRVE